MLTDLLSLLPNALQPQTEGAPAEPPPEGAPVTQGQSPWGAWLSNPANRAMMITTGLQMMTGGWGSPMQNMAYAMGRGMEAKTGTEMLQYEQGEKDREAARKSSEAAAGRENQMKIAELNAASREEVARARISGMLERSKMNLSQKTSGAIALKYRTEARKILEGNPSFMAVDEATRVQMIDETADRLYSADEARGRIPGVPGAGTPAGGSKAGGPVEGGGVETPPKPTAAPAAPTKYTPAQLESAWKELQARPGFAEALKSKEGTDKLIAAHPQLKVKIEAARGSQISSDLLDSTFDLITGGRWSERNKGDKK